MQSSGEKKKLSHDDSLNYFNFKKKLDCVLHNYRRTAYRKQNEKRRMFAKSCDNKRSSFSPNYELQSGSQHSKNSLFNNQFNKPKQSFHLDKRSAIEKKTLDELKKFQEKNEKETLSFDVDEIAELSSHKILEGLKIGGEDDGNVDMDKLKEIVYKLQLRDAVHRQKILKLQNSNSELQKVCESFQSENSKLMELRLQENKNSKVYINSLEQERRKVLSLEKKIKKLDPIDTANLLEQLHQRNEELVKENKRLEEMVKQLLLSREITRIRKLYPAVLENRSPISAEKNENAEEKFNENEENKAPYNKNGKVKNVCLDLKEMLKGI